MPGLVSGKLSKSMKTFMKKANKMTQEDADKAIDAYCDNMESSIYSAIKSIQITIPSGAIKVSGTAAAQTNIAPIVLRSSVS